ncbi:MAG: hypothetical protein EPO26_15515 [Chloroflexota bacterium]|nr:MAG: hypothetical protein EPO26_15515 [Chloroflexota bacterium]
MRWRDTEHVLADISRQIVRLTRRGTGWGVAVTIGTLVVTTATAFGATTLGFDGTSTARPRIGLAAGANGRYASPLAGLNVPVGAAPGDARFVEPPTFVGRLVAGLARFVGLDAPYRETDRQPDSTKDDSVRGSIDLGVRIANGTGARIGDDPAPVAPLGPVIHATSSAVDRRATDTSENAASPSDGDAPKSDRPIDRRPNAPRREDPSSGSIAPRVSATPDSPIAAPVAASTPRATAAPADPSPTAIRTVVSSATPTIHVPAPTPIVALPTATPPTLRPTVASTPASDAHGKSDTSNASPTAVPTEIPPTLEPTVAPTQTSTTHGKSDTANASATAAPTAKGDVTSKPSTAATATPSSGSNGKNDQAGDREKKSDRGAAAEPTPIASDPTPVTVAPTPIVADPTPVTIDPTPVESDPTSVPIAPTPTKNNGQRKTSHSDRVPTTDPTPAATAARSESTPSTADPTPALDARAGKGRKGATG